MVICELRIMFLRYKDRKNVFEYKGIRFYRIIIQAGERKRSGGKGILKKA
jgi:hypothetical protein